MSKRPGATFRKKKQNRLACLCVSVVVAMFVTIIAVDSASLLKRKHELEARIEEYNEGIENEKKRTKELREYKIYTGTRQFVEETAESAFGLVKPGEILFKPDDSQ
ncbi:MAG: septum formation initiator family protein [Lachnospiraceae bacterium]|nr:septum formation initiator family protein [Lachnospiraceae bacterium]